MSVSFGTRDDLCWGCHYFIKHIWVWFSCVYLNWKPELSKRKRENGYKLLPWISEGINSLFIHLYYFESNCKILMALKYVVAVSAVRVKCLCSGDWEVGKLNRFFFYFFFYPSKHSYCELVRLPVNQNVVIFTAVIKWGTSMCNLLILFMTPQFVCLNFVKSISTFSELVKSFNCF